MGFRDPINIARELVLYKLFVERFIEEVMQLGQVFQMDFDQRALDDMFEKVLSRPGPLDIERDPYRMAYNVRAINRRRPERYYHPTEGFSAKPFVDEEATLSIPAGERSFTFEGVFEKAVESEAKRQRDTIAAALYGVSVMRPKAVAATLDTSTEVPIKEEVKEPEVNLQPFDLEVVLDDDEEDE